MLADSKNRFTFTLADHTKRGASPCNIGHFLCPSDKRRWCFTSGKEPCPPWRISSVNATALFVGDNLKYIVMLNDPRTSDNSPQPCPAKSIINNLLLTDNLDDLRHRVSRDYLRLLATEYYDAERDRMLSDFTTIDLVLETIEKERK